jgi:PhnB protein
MSMSPKRKSPRSRVTASKTKPARKAKASVKRAAKKPKVSPIPAGYQHVIPYLTVRNAGQLIEFLERAVGAKARQKMEMPDGRIMHAEVKVGDCVVMLGEANEKWPPRPGTMYVYVPNVDETYRRALAAGGTSLREPTTEFYGDRSAGVTDACGNQWWFGSRVENVSPAEMKRRAAAMMAQPAAQPATT